MSRKRTCISSPEKEAVRDLLKTTTCAKEKERLTAVSMGLSGNHTLAMISEAVGRARSVIQTWLGKFESGGIEGLLGRGKSPGRPTTVTPEIRESIVAELRKGTWRTAGQMQQWLEKEHKLTLSISSCYYWLGKCNGALKMPRPCHRNQKAGAIERFKTEDWEKLLATLPITGNQTLVHFWVMDESRFGLHTIVRHCWGLKGHRVVHPFQQRFEWEYIYGAINVLTGEPVLCFLPTVTKETTWEFLRQVVKTAPEDHHVILWDGAGFHQEVPGTTEWADLKKVHVLKLPPYCPELNPTEKLWDGLKDVVCNKVFDSLEDLRQCLEPTMLTYWDDFKKGKNLIGINWLMQKTNAGFRSNLPVFN
jgi:transposase